LPANKCPARLARSARAERMHQGTTILTGGTSALGCGRCLQDGAHGLQGELSTYRHWRKCQASGVGERKKEWNCSYRAEEFLKNWPNGFRRLVPRGTTLAAGRRHPEADASGSCCAVHRFLTSTRPSHSSRRSNASRHTSPAPDKKARQRRPCGPPARSVASSIATDHTTDKRASRRRESKPRTRGRNRHRRIRKWAWAKGEGGGWKGEDNALRLSS